MCLFHNFHLDVAAGHGKDNGHDGDVEQHGEDEPALDIGPHLENQITNSAWALQYAGLPADSQCP